MSTLKELKLKRGQIQGKITRFQTYLNSIKDSEELVNIEEVKLRLEKARECWATWEDIQEDIESLDDEAERLNYDSDRDKFENLFFSVVGKAEKLCADAIKRDDNNSISSSSTRTKKKTGVNLPEINIPAFSGDYKSWMSFKDLFLALIHKNEDLEDVERLYFLRLSLKGDAAQLIESLELTDANYKVAWDLITNRYENKKLAIEAHVKAIFEQPKIDKESAEALRQLHNTTDRHVRALQALGQPINQGDAILIHLIVSKFDYCTLREWQHKSPSDKIQTYSELEKFLIQRCQFLEGLNAQTSKSQNKSSSTGSTSKTSSNAIQFKSSSQVKTFTSTNSDQQNKSSSTPSSKSQDCVFCNCSHSSYQCPDYLKLSINERWNLANRLKLCKNCLRMNHSTINCKITKSCSKPSCSKRHHSTLHEDQSTLSKNSNENQSSTLSHCSFSINEGVILGTAIIEIMDSSKTYHPFRVLLDSGSENHYISGSMAQTLGLKRIPCNVSVSGIQNTPIDVTTSINTVIKSRYNLFKSELNFLIFPNFTNLPTQSVNHSQWKIPDDIFLADPSFNRSSNIHGIIGAELYFKLIGSKTINLGSCLPTLRETLFGWVVSGRVTKKGTGCRSSSVSLMATSRSGWDESDDPDFLTELKIKNALTTSHVPSKSNPADILPRGCTARQQIENGLWWNGPDWLLQKTLPQLESKDENYNYNILASETKKLQAQFLMSNNNETDIENYLSRFSSYPKAIHVTAYAYTLRIINRTKHLSLLISQEEFDNAKHLLLKRTQEFYFKEDLSCSSKGGDSSNNHLTVENSSKIKSLHPFIDQLGLLRVGGRIQNADISYSHKHPIIIPDYKSNLSVLIGKYYHEKSLHCGAQLFLATIRSNFWPVHGKVCSRKIVNNCVICFKSKPKPASQNLIKLIPTDEVNTFLSLNSIIFLFIPTRSPSFGGIWESGVKSVKHHLKRVIGKSIITFDEFYTLLVEVEACVNSRPLVACSQDPCIHLHLGTS